MRSCLPVRAVNMITGVELRVEVSLERPHQSAAAVADSLDAEAMVEEEVGHQ